MAVGPFARILAQLVVPVVAVLARALPAAYAQALQNARKSGVSAESAAAASNILRKTISKEEALQILNITEQEATVERIQKQYEKYMAANESKNGGGSFYLQSKVYRAKELLDEFQKEKRMEKQQQQQQQEKKNNDSTDDSSSS